MSMLTPPGMGGEYRITGDKYPRLRRPKGRRKLVLPVIAGMAALGLAGWGTLQLIDVFTGGADTATAAGPAPGCTTSASPSPKSSPARTSALPKPGQITVNVLNATSRTGLAKDTAAELKKRGFRIGDVGNATKEYDKKVAGAGLVLGAVSAEDGALPVVATQLSGARLKTDTRKQNTEVDLILGTGFKSLSTQPAAQKALTSLTAPKPTASPSTKKNC